jgi:ribosomal-protein-alanine N-acetyltransferase
VNEFPVLRTKRLLLREFRETDAQSVFDIFSRDEVTRYVNSDTMRTLDEAQEKVRRRISLFPAGQGIRWGIVLSDEEDQVIGSCGFYQLNPQWHSCELGYELHPSYWRRGLMTEAVAAAIDFGYSDRLFYQLNRIQALTFLDSPASVGLLKKLGFREEGIRREDAFWKGQFFDLRCLSLLRRDW